DTTLERHARAGARSPIADGALVRGCGATRMRSIGANAWRYDHASTSSSTTSTSGTASPDGSSRMWNVVMPTRIGASSASASGTNRFDSNSRPVASSMHLMNARNPLDTNAPTKVIASGGGGAAGAGKNGTK